MRDVVISGWPRRPVAERAGLGESFELDSTVLDETSGTPPFVHSSARETDLRAAEALTGEAKRRNDFVDVALHGGRFVLLLADGAEIAGGVSAAVRAAPDRRRRGPRHRTPPALPAPGRVLRTGADPAFPGNFVFDWCDGWCPDSMVMREDAYPASPYKAALLKGP